MTRTSEALRYLRNGLAGALGLCLAVRLLAWLMAPLVPLLIILTLLATAASFWLDRTN